MILRGLALFTGLLIAGPALSQNVVILGEVHDNPQAHIKQAAALEALRPNITRFYTFDQIEALIDGLRTNAVIERPDLSLTLAPEGEDGALDMSGDEATAGAEENLNADQPG